jgi:hypothetical protein
VNGEDSALKEARIVLVVLNTLEKVLEVWLMLRVMGEFDAEAELEKIGMDSADLMWEREY